MTDRIERLRRFFIVDKAHHAVRRPLLAEDCLAADFAQRKLPDTERAVERLCFMLRQEEPHLFPEERIAFVRTLPNVPELFTAEELAERYRQLAERQGNTVVARTLARVPRYAPRTFLEALQMFRILHFTMWLGGNYHNTLGLLDQ